MHALAQSVHVLTVIITSDKVLAILQNVKIWQKSVYRRLLWLAFCDKHPHFCQIHEATKHSFFDPFRQKFQGFF